MLQELSGLSDNTYQNEQRRKALIKFFSTRNLGLTLDLGQKSKMTDTLAPQSTEMHNTGHLDLDYLNHWPTKGYDTILCLDVLEHLFNPLSCVNLAVSLLKADGFMYIGLPKRPCFLKTKNHFHEITEYEFKLLCKRAGLEIVERYVYKVKRKWYEYLKGIRPLLRMVLEYGVVYRCKPTIQPHPFSF
jgi:2-polyprenyl-3-methyl-5-hydroxy-6-metoxy-1,4-benzoquinol methylase